MDEWMSGWLDGWMAQIFFESQWSIYLPIIGTPQANHKTYVRTEIQQKKINFELFFGILGSF